MSAPADPAPGSNGGRGPARPGERRLVLVDDDALVHLALDRHLRGTSWRVAGYRMAAAALADLTLPPEVMLVDLNMPQMRGDDFLTALEPAWTTGSCRIFLCSAVWPPQAARASAERAGASILDKAVLSDRARLRCLLESGDGFADGASGSAL